MDQTCLRLNGESTKEHSRFCYSQASSGMCQQLDKCQHRPYLLATQRRAAQACVSKTAVAFSKQVLTAYQMHAVSTPVSGTAFWHRLSCLLALPKLLMLMFVLTQPHMQTISLPPLGTQS